MSVIEALKWAFKIGKRLIEVECRHCGGLGICHSGMRATLGSSCLSCIRAAGFDTANRLQVVKCDICGGRGVFYYLPPAKLPTIDRDHYRVVELQPIPPERLRDEQNPELLLDSRDTDQQADAADDTPKDA